MENYGREVSATEFNTTAPDRINIVLRAAK